MQYVNSVFVKMCFWNKMSCRPWKIHVKGSEAIFRLILCEKKIDSLQKQHTSFPLVTLALFVYMISKISTGDWCKAKTCACFYIFFSLDVMVN